MKRALLCSCAALLLGTTPAAAPVGRDAQELRNQLKRERAHHHRDLRALARAGATRASVSDALTLASVVYGVPRWALEAVARRESGLRPWVSNYEGSGAAGLFQMMPGTYAGTPPGRAGLSVFSPYANALGAAWLVSRGGWGPWAASGGTP